MLTTTESSRWISRQDFLDKDSPPEIEVFQLVTGANDSLCHIYPEAQIFTPDSRFFVLHKGMPVQGGDHKNPAHQCLLCDVESGELTPLTDEIGVTAPVISPDGQFFYYFVDENAVGSGKLSLRRRRIEGGRHEVISVLDGPVPGTKFHASLPNPLATISSDGERLAISCFLGDGKHTGSPFGLLVFELLTGECRLILSGPSWRNIHAQYCRSDDPRLRHDILIQENHGGLCEKDGKLARRGQSRGADIHVIRDDGQHLRNMPWGRVPGEWCSGHQCWRGDTEWAIGTLVVGSQEELREKHAEIHLIESRPIPHSGHEGRNTPDGKRNDLTRGFAKPHFNHIATDRGGTQLIADFRRSWNPEVQDNDAIYVMKLGKCGTNAASDIQYLFSPQSSWLESAHVHPFLSPDGRTAFFNSDKSGQTQAFMIRNLA